ncbi:cystathionine beta-lyase [Methylovorus menthalis]|uniref:cystathionine beta-lyase n=1 Tax=Methylovorus menthalis TaxID=1002227 RepID=UPI001E3BC346|nr:cystathionine beta-lyase [Methylovorus menthalis]MCB4811656.1 cystathionine beta-lyase [Methylovorus menthalis]
MSNKPSSWTALIQPDELAQSDNCTSHFSSLVGSMERASTVVFPDVKSMRERDWRNKSQYSYGLLGTPTTRRLERKLALIDNVKHALLLPSGLAAVSLIFLALLKTGERVLLPRNAYQPGADLARMLAGRFGIEVDFYDPLQPEALPLTANTRLLWVETPGSVTMEVADLKRLAELAHARGVLVAADATWSAGIAQNVFALGADIGMQALTKYQSGGSDVMMGSVSTDDDALHELLLKTHMQLGLGVSPEDCQLVLRSLPHYRLRYLAQDASARKLAHWLAAQPCIELVLHPALPSCPGHVVWQRDFTAAASLFSVLFKPEISQAGIDAFVEALALFHIGYSWGGAVSLAIPYDVHDRYPQSGGLVRFYVGLEEVDDLIADVQQALAKTIDM